jgi:hypothetical protein
MFDPQRLARRDAATDQQVDERVVDPVAGDQSLVLVERAHRQGHG